MGGATITIEEDTLLQAIKKLIEETRDSDSIGLWLDSITILIKRVPVQQLTEYKDNQEYDAIGNKAIELQVGTNYAKEQFTKNIIIFAHFGK